VNYRPQGVAVILLAMAAGSAAAGDSSGTIVGWVEDHRGEPLAGAMISLMGKGLALVTFSDSQGHYSLPSLPAGSYTVRALRAGHRPTSARKVTVLPNQEAVLSLSLAPRDEPSVGTMVSESSDSSDRELRWLLRHKRRSILETDGPGPSGDTEEAVFSGSTDKAASNPDLAGAVEVVTNPGVLGALAGIDTVPARFSVVRLRGRLAEYGRWNFGGLVTESQATTWRMAADLVSEPVGGHEIQVGSAYGRLLRPALPTDDTQRLEGQSVGSVFARDQWSAAERLTASLAARYSYIGFLEHRNRLDPEASVTFQTSPRTQLSGIVSARTLCPGGDLLTLSTLTSAPTIAYAVIDRRLQAERILRYELAFNQEAGPVAIGVRAFQEGVHDPLVNSFEGAGPSRTLRISNGSGLGARGAGFSVTRRVGRSMGSVSYTYGHSWGEPSVRPAVGPDGALLVHYSTSFHDVVARAETVIDWTDTRVSVYYRINAQSPDQERVKGQSVANSRFDIQLRQALPLIGSLTKADWEILVAFRNLFYEASEGGVLDEMAVQNPPKRLLGGISVRF